MDDLVLDWIRNHGVALQWILICTLYVALRIRHHGGDGPLPTRVRNALFRRSTAKYPQRPEASELALVALISLLVPLLLIATL